MDKKCCFFSSNEQGVSSHSESDLRAEHFYLVLFRLSRRWIQINAMKFAFEMHVCSIKEECIENCMLKFVLSEV